MTASVADHDLSAAILSSIREGTFPDSEDVLTAELPATALPSILGEVSDARKQLEVQQCIKKLKTTLRLTNP
jgi:protein transport protein DSL1/ZW10